ncbi:contact-dependent growth inhibition system immunity protein [Streptomyces sp. NBC_00385]|uniref:contact-dependent growth inhibition system immunity protein n=1 Tax=Streptomyces sp. NBC_00385 TaxID=2975733 RepID=UPI003FA37367
MATAHALRSKPVGTLTVEDPRLLIGQDVGLPVLLALAVEVLRDNPLAAGDMYEGDLLRAVLARSPAVWSAYPDLPEQLTLAVGGLSDISPDRLSTVERFLSSVQSP